MENNIDLSVLVCTVEERRNTFFPKAMDAVYKQKAALPKALRERVQIIALQDDKTMMLGEKRNVMVGAARGKYVTFVDDDDTLSPRYLQAILQAIRENESPDVICYEVQVSLNGGPAKKCIYSKDFHDNRNTRTGYERLPNHLCVVKRELALKATFPHIKYGEDTGFAKLLKPLLKTQHSINEVLYYYNYNDKTTVAQEDRPQVILNRPNSAPPVCDVVIISDGKTPHLRAFTQETIDTCLAGANGLNINIVVVEHSHGVGYKNCKVVYPPAGAIFNYNGAANYGAMYFDSDWLMIANNDLIFQDGWLHELLAANHPLVSPKCPNDPRQREIEVNTEGTTNGKHFSGWCFMIKRGAYNELRWNQGEYYSCGFDEDVTFWCSDDAVIEQAGKLGVKPMLVPGARVTHRGSSTLRTIDSEARRKELTTDQVRVFNKKYNKDKFGIK